MKQGIRAAGLAVIAAFMAVALISVVLPGCIDQNQDNSPISISNAQGRRLEMAAKYDPREPPPVDSASQNPDQNKQK